MEYRTPQDSDKILAADRLAEKLETVVDSPDPDADGGDESGGGGGSRRQSTDRQRRVGSVAAPPANDE